VCGCLVRIVGGGEGGWAARRERYGQGGRDLGWGQAGSDGSFYLHVSLYDEAGLPHQSIEFCRFGKFYVRLRFSFHMSES
jgi:hypothetical protein